MYKWSEESLLRELCCLFGSYEDRVCDVMPFEGKPSKGNIGMWIEPTRVERSVGKYINGSETRECGFKLCMKYPSISPSDRLFAVSNLKEMCMFACKSANITGNFKITSVGEAVRQSGDKENSFCVFALPFSVRFTESGESDTESVSYYINSGTVGTPVWNKIGEYVTKFEYVKRAEMYTRCYIHENFERHDICAEHRRFDFVFGPDDSCALSCLARGISSAEIMSVSSVSGKAERVSTVLSELKYSADEWIGTLSVTGESIMGEFDEASGVFSADVSSDAEE